MPFEHRPAKRADVELLIGLSGGTGSGKTYSGMRLAAGMAEALGQERFAVVDTENGRALHYADFFNFEHGNLRPPFTPDSYAEAVTTFVKDGFKVVLVDSASHEWAGEGGVLEMQEAEFAAMNYDDKKKLLSWVRPKMAHKRMVNVLLQQRAHIILCFRAESKIEIAKEGNRTVVREKEGLTGIRGWFPVAEKNMAFELTCSLLLTQEARGVPVPIKLQEQHKHLFPLDTPITEDSGRKIIEWAQGGNVDWIARIRGAWSTQELEGIARQLKTMRLAPADREAA